MEQNKWEKGIENDCRKSKIPYRSPEMISNWFGQPKPLIRMAQPIRRKARARRQSDLFQQSEVYNARVSKRDIGIASKECVVCSLWKRGSCSETGVFVVMVIGCAAKQSINNIHLPYQTGAVVLASFLEGSGGVFSALASYWPVYSFVFPPHQSPWWPWKDH